MAVTAGVPASIGLFGQHQCAVAPETIDACSGSLTARVFTGTLP